MIAIVTRMESGGFGEDRIVVHPTKEATVVVVADGAGGVGNGAIAAEATCALIVARLPHWRLAQVSWSEALREVDVALRKAADGGLSTAVVAEIGDHCVRGASVGDSGA